MFLELFQTAAEVVLAEVEGGVRVRGTPVQVISHLVLIPR